MFWDLEGGSEGDVAVFDSADGRTFTYGQLRAEADRFGEVCPGGAKRLVMLFADNTLPSLAAYLGCLRAGHAVHLVPSTLDRGLADTLIGTYRPEIVWPASFAGRPTYEAREAGGFGSVAVSAGRSDGPPIHADLGVLLSTSGTVGSPKLVRLSYRNLEANAASIARYLEIDSGERAITTLPLSYSYGLSVVNSHLLAGARIVLTDRPVVMRDMWELFRKQECTSFAGVPHTYRLLERVGVPKMDLPSLGTLTQAGGRLSEDFQRRFHEHAARWGARFYVMYGQTEATARISYVPFERLPEKYGSIGVAIPDGRLWVESESGETLPEREPGELVYAGPNVMLGYAETRECLAKGDELGGVLRTGDLGYRDGDGFFYITGRLRRFLKMFGVRLSLDEAERMLEAALGCAVACIGRDDELVIVVETEDAELSSRATHAVIERYGLHRSLVRGVHTAAIPVAGNSKKDYKAMEEEFVAKK